MYGGVGAGVEWADIGSRVVRNAVVLYKRAKAAGVLFCEVKGYGPLQTIVTIAFSLED